MTEAKHTPGKLVVHGVWIADDAAEKMLFKACYHGMTVLEARANAARLVLCWNTHDALVEALAATVPAMDVLADVAQTVGVASHLPGLSRVIENARAALALARGEA